MDLTEIRSVLHPEIIVLIGILLTLAMSLFNSSKKYVPGLAAIVLVTASIAAAMNFPAAESKTILFNSFNHDALSIYFRFLIYGASFLIVLGSNQYLKRLESPSEYYPIILTASLGAGFLVSANDFLVFFVALETLGLSAILLASYARLNQGSNEAGIKYLINSAVATAVLLLGISMIYGLTASTNFNEIALRIFKLAEANLLSPSLLALISICLVATIGFKLAAAPFHNWSPDVYTGAPTTTTVFLSVVSKVAALGLAIRLFHFVFLTQEMALLISVLAILSIIIGNYVGVIQMISRGSVKRLLAYSSIAQAGYLLIGLAVFQGRSVAALIMYLTVYALMNTGAFLALIYFEQTTGSDEIYDMSGLIKKRPGVVIAASLCLVNLAGLPFIPAGFIAKFYLFSSAYTSGLSFYGINFGLLLAIVGLIGSLIGLFYYLYLIKIMVVDEPSTLVKQLDDKEPEGNCLVKLSLYLSVVLMAVIGIFGMDLLRGVASTVLRALN